MFDWKMTHLARYWKNGLLFTRAQFLAPARRMEEFTHPRASIQLAPEFAPQFAPEFTPEFTPELLCKKL